MKDSPYFLIFDDDPVNNTLCQIIIRKIIKEADIKTFRDRRRGYQYVISDLQLHPGKNIILLRDINMGGMTCWDFLEEFNNLSSEIKDQFKIYILSASSNPIDKERAKTNKYVQGYIEKPLTFDNIFEIISIPMN